jgi:hypothetical protein
MASGPEVHLNVNLPDQHVEGHYADFANIWHTPETFVLDFLATARPPHPVADGQGSATTVLDAQVVTRVRIPAAQVWEVMKALEQQYTAWEQETGRRTP